MAAKSKEVKIDKRVFTARELIIDQVKAVCSDEAKEPIDRILELLSYCSDATAQEIGPLAPSEIRQLVDAILEVNSDFFDFAAQLQMAAAAKQLEGLIRSIFLIRFIDSSPPATE